MWYHVLEMAYTWLAALARVESLEPTLSVPFQAPYNGFRLFFEIFVVGSLSVMGRVMYR